jgi:protein-S-isoprenylcysteine O-methyltransferase Ste14
MGAVQEFQTETIDWKSKYARLVIGRTRFAVGWAFALILIFSARDFPNWYGTLIVFLGASFRFWSSGYIRKDSRPAVGGPYGLTRNPLYLGTYVMAIGAALAVSNYWLLILVTIIFAAIYHFVIVQEEERLDVIFGASYHRYAALVPRFFPRPFPVSKAALKEVNPEESHFRFSWDLSRKNKAYEAYASFFGLIGVMVLVAFIWKEFLS